MRKLVLASIAWAVLIAAPSHAALPAPYGGWAAKSHAPLPAGVAVSSDLSASPCAAGGWVLEVAGCANTDTRTVYMAEPKRSIFYHELGHVFDARVMSDPYRAAFAAILRRRYDPATYWATAGTERGLPEWFAEGYMLCSLRGPSRGEPSSYAWLEYGYDPSVRQQRRVCALIRRATSPASAPATA